MVPSPTLYNHYRCALSHCRRGVWSENNHAFEEASLVAQRQKNLLAMQETQARSLSQEDPLEKEMAIHFRILAWRFPWTEESGGLQSMGSQRVGQD